MTSENNKAQGGLIVDRVFYDKLNRRSKLGPSIDHLAIVYLLLARPPPDWRSFV